ncbi:MULTISPECIES: DesA family fatty acid desaturase [Azotobacter]|nr:fatty acid desaturase [Azotobacter vinelandii]SFW98704.1 Fatty-acid desaturase [Azotobacter vinelandii]
MWYDGFLDPTPWQLIMVTLLITHLTVVSVTVYLHRYSAHRALELHPAVKHAFRFWLWLTTGMNTREWTAVHRKHHACCETPEDPHSPRYKGLANVLWRGAELYKAEAGNTETLRIYGKNCPDDWIERHVYSRFPNGGAMLMLLIDLALFGAFGLSVWAVQMLWIPFWAAGVVNGLGHAVGYRNFECRDAATNLVPWGILIGGEELHNNHHTYPGSAKLSVRPWEFDMGWAWIRLLVLLGLAEVKRTVPVAHRVADKRHLDMDTARAILNNRFQIMAHYRSRVIAPQVRMEAARAEASVRHLFHRAKGLLARESSLLEARQQARIQSLLEQSQTLRVVYERRLALQQVWTRTSANGHEMLAAIRAWVHEAEASGIQSLCEFAEHLKTYSLRPAPSLA